MRKTTDQIRLVSIFAVALIGVAAPPLSARADDDLARPPQVSSAPEDNAAPTVALTPAPVQAPSTVRTLGMLQPADMVVPPLPPTQKMQVQQNGTVAYVTGGVGQEERDALEAAKNNYNLHITVANKEGQFLSDTRIIIRDRKGNEVLEAVAGPIFYAQLPPESYTIEAASSEGQVKKQTITVGKDKGNKPASLHFTW